MEDFLDQSAFLPLYEPFVHRLPWPVTLRQITPCRTAPRDPEDSVQYLPRIFLRPSQRSSLPLWKVFLKLFPFLIRDLITSNHFLHLIVLFDAIEKIPFGFCIFFRFCSAIMNLETHSNSLQHIYNPLPRSDAINPFHSHRSFTKTMAAIENTLMLPKAAETFHFLHFML